MTFPTVLRAVGTSYTVPRPLFPELQQVRCPSTIPATPTTPQLSEYFHGFLFSQLNKFIS